jgi:hypothetical protein
MKGTLERFRLFRRQEAVHGIERLFIGTILLLRILSLSSWLRLCFPQPRTKRQRVRDNAIDAYCVLQVLTVGTILGLHTTGVLSVVIAGYILFEIFLVNLNIVFVGKFPELQAPPASIERTIILLFMNLVEVVGIFAVFYAYAGLSRIDAIFNSALVLGTVGYPPLHGPAKLVIILQVFLDLILGLLLLSTLAAHMGFFRRPDLYKHSQPMPDEIQDEKRSG